MIEYLCPACGRWVERYPGGLKTYLVCVFCGSRHVLLGLESREKAGSKCPSAVYDYRMRIRRRKELISSLPTGYISVKGLERILPSWRRAALVRLMNRGVVDGLCLRNGSHSWIVLGDKKC